MHKKKIISPCVSVCRLDTEEVCIGCGRTRKEIREWTFYSDKRRVTIMQRLGVQCKNYSMLFDSPKVEVINTALQRLIALNLSF